MRSLSLGTQNLPGPRPIPREHPAKAFVEINAALGVSAFVLAATVGGFRMRLLVMIAVNGSQGRTLRREVVNHW